MLFHSLFPLFYSTYKSIYYDVNCSIYSISFTPFCENSPRHEVRSSFSNEVKELAGLHQAVLGCYWCGYFNREDMVISGYQWMMVMLPLSLGVQPLWVQWVWAAYGPWITKSMVESQLGPGFYGAGCTNFPQRDRGRDGGCCETRVFHQIRVPLLDEGNICRNLLFSVGKEHVFLVDFPSSNQFFWGFNSPFFGSLTPHFVIKLPVLWSLFAAQTLAKASIQGLQESLHSSGRHVEASLREAGVGMGRATWGKADRLVGGFKMFQALCFSYFGRVETTSLFE